MLVYISGCRGVIGCKVATGGVLCAKKFALLGLMMGVSAKKFALLGLMVGVSAKKFAQRAQNGPNSAFLRLLGEVFRGNAGGGVVLGEVFRDPAAVGVRGRTLLRRGRGSWAPLLAVLTLQCAAKPT